MAFNIHEKGERSLPSDLFSQRIQLFEHTTIHPVAFFGYVKIGIKGTRSISVLC